MLKRRPEQRITAHRWVVDDRVAPHNPLDSAVITRLKHFSAMKKLEKMDLHNII
ncbi:putative non-specific serine/threonine protein kinase [Helianthus debilis subsp. tardiflorus]